MSRRLNSKWKNGKTRRKVTKLDVTVGKNYLSQEELDELNRLVSMYLDWAENLLGDIFQRDEGLGRKARWDFWDLMLMMY